MEPIALVLVFQAWDTDVCISLPPNVKSLSDGFEPVVVALRTLGGLG